MKGKRLLAGFLSAMLILSAMTSPSYATEGVVEGSEVSSAAEIAFDKNAENSIESSAPDEGDSAGAVQDSENMNEEHMSVQEFTDGSEEVNVTVNAPEGAFGAGTSMEVSKADEAAIKAAAEAVNAEVSDVEAAEITFIAEGVEVEPAVAVRVSMKYSRAVDADRIRVVHVDDDAKAEIITDADVNTEEQTVSFDADSFSVYAVVYAADTENGEDEIVPLDEKDNYVFQINYVFEDGTTAAQSYSGTFAKGSGYSTTVKNPEVQGYAATAPTAIPEGVTVNFTADALEYSFTGISRDIILNVVYKPALVNYTVRYYQQNVDDDQYTLVDTVTNQGYTGAIVSETYENTKDKYEGFYGLRFETPAIAADGSTEVEIKYDRNYYMLSFDLGGGYGVEPVYARYGAAVEEVGTPVRAGYTFKGWSPEVPDTVPVGGGTYTAQWEAPDTAKVTVVYWGENANDTGYSYLSSEDWYKTPGEEVTYTDCPLEEHSHTKDCYTGVGNSSSKPSGAPSNPAEGEVYKYSFLGVFSRSYIYISGSWYEYNGSASSGSIVSPSCGKTVHVHDASCKNLNFDANLWIFEKADTVQVAADGSTVLNVYYKRTTFTITFKASGNNGSTLGTITAKWGANITQEFYDISSKNTFYWSRNTNGNSPWTSYLSAMPAENITYYKYTANGSELSAQYIGQDLAGSYTIDLYNTKLYGSGITVTVEEYVEIEGFTFNADKSTKTGSSYNGAKFYYDRNSYTLVFNDGYNDVKTETVKYEASLGVYAAYQPELPAAYEQGAYVFGGWYLNPQCTGEEYKLNEHTMPASNLLLYAKWVPVTHTVKVYTDVSMAIQIGETQTVAHGANAISPGTPTNGSYTFIGWFYKDANGVEKAFDFDSMPVRRDMEIYAKWGSNVLKDYTIRYVLEDGTVIADSTTGSALAGTTKTFEAKSGDALYADYTEGYFPVENSHSLTIDIEDDTKNVYDFVFKPSETVPYQVKYVDADTGAEIAETKVVVDNRHSVVTETAVTVSGYLPDRYQKRLVISYSEDKENVTEANTLIFYYTKDDTHALVIDTHYILPLNSMDEARATEYQQNQETGTIGNSYTRNALTITNYVLDHVKVNDQEVMDDNIDSITRDLTAAGLVFEFYYRPVVFYVYHSSTASTESIFMGDVKADGTYDITAKTASGYYYGGYYSDLKASSKGISYTGQAGFWTKSNAITINGTTMKPVPGTTYYLKEVPAGYLRPYIHVVYNTYRGNALSQIYLMTAVEDTNYTDIGLNVFENVAGERLKLAASFTITNAETGSSTKVTPATAFGSYGVTRGYLGVWDANKALESMNTQFSYQAYWTTPDGVTVNGTVIRSVDTGDNTYQNFQTPGITYTDK